MERKNKACWNCGNFDRFYRKGTYSFSKTNLGRCTVCKKIVESCELCERWRNTFTLMGKRKQLALNILNETLTSIVAIRQILEEENEERKINPGHREI